MIALHYPGSLIPERMTAPIHVTHQPPVPFTNHHAPTARGQVRHRPPVIAVHQTGLDTAPWASSRPARGRARTTIRSPLSTTSSTISHGRVSLQDRKSAGRYVAGMTEKVLVDTRGPGDVIIEETGELADLRFYRASGTALAMTRGWALTGESEVAFLERANALAKDANLLDVVSVLSLLAGTLVEALALERECKMEEILGEMAMCLLTSNDRVNGVLAELMKLTT